MRAIDWYTWEREVGFPMLKRGAVFLSMWHGNLINQLVGVFQGKGSDWSHAGVYIGWGKVAEATYPRGRIIDLRHYMSKEHTLEIYNPPWWSEMERAKVASEAARIAYRPYDTWKFARHLIDNIFERITWDAEKQQGMRPLSRLMLDRDKDKRNVCSELVGRAVAYGTGERIVEGELGTARPWDIYTWLVNKNASPTFRHSHGKVEHSLKDGIRYV